MYILVLVGNLAFSLCSLVLGIRLCRLAQRTRRLPELLIGVSFLSGGVFGHTLGWLLFLLKPRDPWLAVLVFTLRGGAAVACALIAVMAWRVFRPHADWAKLLVWVEVALLVSYVLRDALLGRLPAAELMRQPIYWANALALTAPYVWITWESVRYQAILRRRWRVGLPADMVVAARMLLWAIGLGAIGGMLLILDVLRVIGVVTGVVISPALMISSLGLVCSIALWLAFFPPQSYVRRIELQAASPPS